MANQLLELLRRMPVVGRRSIRAELVRRYQTAFGRLPCIEAPRGFNERMLHRILYERDPRLRTLCDKLAARDFISRHAGPEFLVPLLGVWKDPASIAWDSLPRQFVLKSNHASGAVAIVNGEAKRNPAALSALAAEWLGRDYFDETFEWGYRNLPRRVMAEPLLAGPGGGLPTEVQVMTFHGKAALFKVLSGVKNTPNRRENWFDTQGRAMELSGVNPLGNCTFPASDAGKLASVAERVAAGFSHLRVDFYLTDGGPRLGELTAYNNAGREPWNPPEWDEKLGRLWEAGATADA